MCEFKSYVRKKNRSFHNFSVPGITDLAISKPIYYSNFLNLCMTSQQAFYDQALEGVSQPYH